MTDWEEQEKLIDGLGMMYPTIKGWPAYYETVWSDYMKLAWVCVLCIENLNQRIPQLEELMKHHGITGWWCWYKNYFGC